MEVRGLSWKSMAASTERGHRGFSWWKFVGASPSTNSELPRASIDVKRKMEVKFKVHGSKFHVLHWVRGNCEYKKRRCGGPHSRLPSPLPTTVCALEGIFIASKLRSFLPSSSSLRLPKGQLLMPAPEL